MPRNLAGGSNFKWINPLGTSTWTCYTLCGRFYQHVISPSRCTLAKATDQHHERVSSPLRGSFRAFGPQVEVLRGSPLRGSFRAFGPQGEVLLDRLHVIQMLHRFPLVWVDVLAFKVHVFTSNFKFSIGMNEGVYLNYGYSSVNSFENHTPSPLCCDQGSTRGNRVSFWTMCNIMEWWPFWQSCMEGELLYLQIWHNISTQSTHTIVTSYLIID